MLPLQTFVVPVQGVDMLKLKLPEMVPVVAGATAGMMVRFSDV
jgi:hypothetical protein